jgi:alkanesulfonate monooxygenase SsuD/methylene tetrahydromethanopterin reductase-like flavin-dependent oxidoreductase (luciferase family)
VFLGEHFTLEGLVRLAEDAEQADLDFVSVGDSILAKPRYSPIVTLGVLAARTRRIELATGIIQPHLRNPVLLAQEWATLDVASGGRTAIGVGLGTGPRPLVEREYRLVGLPIAHRGQAFEESITLLRRLWTEDTIVHDGPHFPLGEVSAGFRPARRPHPPILIACGGYIPVRQGTGPNDYFRDDVAGTFHGPMDRVARLGDGWITGIVTPSEFAAAFALVREHAERRGRDLDDAFDARLNCFVRVDGDAARGRRDGVAFLEAYHRLPFDDDTTDRWLIAGSPQECVERVAAYVAAGVTSFQFVLADVDQHAQLARLVETVLGPIRNGLT